MNYVLTQCKTTKSPAPKLTAYMVTLLALGMVKKSRNLGCKIGEKCFMT